MARLSVRLRALGAKFDTVAVAAEGCDALVASGVMPTACGYDRPRGGDRRRRSDRADAGGRADVGRGRRRHRRATRQSGARRLARRRAARAHHRGARSARHRRSVPRRRARRCRSRGSPGSRWTSATSPPATTTGWRCGRAHFERILAGWVDELGVPIPREREVTGFAQDDTGVDVELSDGTSLRADYLVGCDGGRSVVRKAAGIEFAGWDPTTSWMIAEVEMAERARDRHAPRGRWHRSRRPGARRRAVPGRAQGDAGRPHRRAHPGGSPRGARRRLRDGLRGAQPHLDLPLHRHDAAGGVLPRRTGAARRRRRPRASAARRPGPQHRRAGCREPRLEAGPGGQRDVAGEPARHLPRRTAPGRGPGAAEHHGAGRAQHAPTTATRPCATP